MSTVIKFGLSPSEIQRAIDEVAKFKADFEKKVETYRKRVADEIRKIASLNFANSIVDDAIIGGFPRKADVKVRVDEQGKVSVVVAYGKDAVWCEFGSGVYHNGSVGSSPHPKGGELGFTIGSYGKGYGKGKAWGYEDEDGNLVITRGTPASMPMYNAAQEVLRKSVEIAREVFGND